MTFLEIRSVPFTPISDHPMYAKVMYHRHQVRKFYKYFELVIICKPISYLKVIMTFS